MRYAILVFIAFACKPADSKYSGLPEGVSVSCDRPGGNTDFQFHKCLGSDGVFYQCIGTEEGKSSSCQTSTWACGIEPNVRRSN